MTKHYTYTLPESTLPLVVDAFDESRRPEYIGAAAHDIALDDAMDALVSRVTRDYAKPCSAVEPCARILARDARTGEQIIRRNVGKSTTMSVHGQAGPTSMDATPPRAAIVRTIARGIATAESEALSFYNRTERYKKAEVAKQK